MVKLEQHTTAQINALPTTAGRLVYDSDLNTVKYINGTSAIEVGSGGALTAPVGISTSAPDKALEINSTTGDCLRLTYNDADGTASNYTDLTVSSIGDLIINPSGGDINLDGGCWIQDGSSNTQMIIGSYGKAFANSEYSFLAAEHTGSLRKISLGMSDNNVAQIYIEMRHSNNAHNDVFMSFNTSSDDVVSATEKMRLTHDGNFGIGTTSPNVPLHVKATTTNGIRIEQTTNSAAAANIIYQSNIYSWEVGARGSTASNAPSSYYIYQGGYRLVIDSAGLVGIGTTNPDKQLEINSSTGDCLRLTYNDSNGTAATYTDLRMSAVGTLFIEPTGSKVVLTGSTLGVNTTVPGKQCEINSATGGCLRLTYNDANGGAANYADMDVSATGDLTITPSGGDVDISSHNGTTTGLKLGGVLVTKTAAELNAGGGGSFTAFNTGEILVRSYSGPDMTGRMILREVVTTIDLTDYNPDGQTDNYSLEVIGYIKPLYTQTYTFYISSNDKVKFWVNDINLYQKWSATTTVNIASTTIALTANTWYPIYIQHSEITGSQNLTIKWQSTSQANEIIPSSALAWDDREPNVKQRTYVKDVLTIIRDVTTDFGYEFNTLSGGTLNLNGIGGASVWNSNLGLTVKDTAASAFKVNNDSSVTVFNVNTTSSAVGINTTSSDKALEINSATGNCLRLTYNDSNGSAAFYTDFNISATGIFTLTGLTTMKFITPGAISFDSSNSIFKSKVWVTTNPTDVDDAFLVRNAAYQHVFKVDTINERVGIFTSLPNKALEINSATGDCLRLTYNDADGNAANKVDLLVSATGDLTITPSGGDVDISSHNGTTTGLMLGGILVTKTAAEINALGGGLTAPVGIDTSAPDKALEINSATGDCLRLTYNDADGNAANACDFEVTSSGRLVIDPVGSSNDILFEFAGSNLLFSKSGTIDSIVQNASSGKLILNPSVYSVGIGTTNPDKKLEINSTTGDCLRLTYNDADGSAANYADLTVSSTGDLTIASSGGNITISGTIDIEDNTLLLNSAPSGSGRDSGIIIERYQIANDAGTGDVVTDTAKETYALDAATSTTITLPAGGNATDDYYNNWWIKMTSGAGINEVRQVTDYVGSTKVATLATAFTATISAADNVSLYNKPYSTMIWQEANNTFVSAYISTDVTGALTIIDKADFECNNLAGTLTTAAQPNVTSLGTLSSLTLSGAISGVTTLTATSLAGTLTTAAQPNITSVGTLSSLTLSGAISGVTTLTATSLAGTLTTAAQTNVTSLGTLSLLNITNTGGTSLTITSTTNTSSSHIKYNTSGDDWEFGAFGSAAGIPNSMYWYNGANRMVLSSSGYLGIGTIAPDRSLEINSSTGDCLRLTYNDSNGSAANYTDLAVNSDGRLILTSSKGKVGIHSDNRGTYDVEKEPTLQIMQYDDYNGIGDVALGEFTALRIGTNSGNKNNNEVTSYTIDYDYNQDRFTAGKLIFKSMNNTAGAGANDLSFQTTKSTGWTVNSVMTLWDTNVGIGTTSPTELLHIASTGPAFIRIEADTDDDGTETDNAGIIISQDNGVHAGYVGLEGTAGQTITGSTANVLLIASNGTTAREIQFATNDTIRLTIDTAGDIAIGGNCNIGDVDIGSYTTNFGTSDNVFLVGDATSAPRKTAWGMGDNSKTQCYIEMQHTNNTANDSIITFNTSADSNTNTTERMRIDWNGNVGIGTTLPAEILDIQRSGADNYIRVQAGSTTANYSGIMLTEYNIYYGWSLRHNADDDNLYISHQTSTPTFTDFVTFKPNGDVGINTSSPAEKLTIYQGNILLDDSNTYANEKYISAKWESTGNTHSIGMHFDYYTGTGTTSTTHSRIRFISNAEDNEAIYGTGKQDMMTILSNGNVGIGEISPTMRLSLGATAADKILALYDTSSFYGFGANGSLLKYQAGGGHAFYTSSTDVSTGTERMRIETGGDVGIGTTNALSRFHIKQSSLVSGGGLWLESSVSGSRWELVLNSGSDLSFIYNGTAKGWLSDVGSNVQMNFTGQHRSFTNNTNINTNPNDYIGLIVSSTGVYKNMNDDAIAINDALPIVDLSTIDNDKKIFGVISDRESENDDRVFQVGIFGTHVDKNVGDERLFINGLGEGMVWVCDKGGNLENGDYITSSTATGYGQLQSDDILHNYTVAKITQDCDFTTLTITRWIDLNGAIITEATYDANTALGYRCYFVGCSYHCS